MEVLQMQGAGRLQVAACTPLHAGATSEALTVCALGVWTSLLPHAYHLNGHCCRHLLQKKPLPLLLLAVALEPLVKSAIICNTHFNISNQAVMVGSCQPQS